MDGKHICTGTNRNGRYYFNFKKFFRIVLFVVVDTNKNFIHVDGRFEGSILDAGVITLPTKDYLMIVNLACNLVVLFRI